MAIHIKHVNGHTLYTSTSATDVKTALTEAVAARANLADANLAGANLADANLADANLAGAYLARANLAGAYLADANLAGAYLARANLAGAYLAGADAARLSVLPDEGDVIGWKKADSGKIVKLLIPGAAARSNATGRKCRAAEATVLAIYNSDGTDAAIAHSRHDPEFTYTVGATVRPTQPFDNNRWAECAPGIHFFITRAEAEAW